MYILCSVVGLGVGRCSACARLKDTTFFRSVKLSLAFVGLALGNKLLSPCVIVDAVSKLLKISRSPEKYHRRIEQRLSKTPLFVDSETTRMFGVSLTTRVYMRDLAQSGNQSSVSLLSVISESSISHQRVFSQPSVSL